KPEAKPAPEPAPEPKAGKSKPKAAAKPEPKPAPEAAAPVDDIVPNRDEALSRVDDDLGDAFGGDDTSFTETMTGIVETVTKSLKPKKKDKPAADEASASSSAMAIESAPATDGTGGSMLTDPKILGIGAVAVVAVVSIAIWAFSGSDETTGPAPEPLAGETAPAAEALPPVSEPVAEPVDESVLQTEVVVPEALGVSDLIDEARELAAAGQIFAPEGNNAIEVYLTALDIAPGDAVAQQGLEESIDQSLGLAEAAVLERRADDALAALRAVELAEPGNSRLPFLQAQVSQMQLRAALDDARAAIRDGRFEDAQLAIDSARGLDVADSSEIAVVVDELSTALSNQRLDEVLAQANARLEEGNLIAPSNDNARYYFELVLSNDPENTAARQGLAVIASRLVLQSREQIDQGNFDDAEALLIDARRLDPASSELAAATVALSDARQRRAQEIQAARDRAAEERAAAEQAAAERAAAERAAAERAAAEQMAADQAAAERLAVEQPAADQVVSEQAPAQQTASPPPQQSQTVIDEPVAQQAAVQQPVAEQRFPQQPAASGAVAGAGGAVENSSPAPAASLAQATPVSVSSLKRTKYVAPKYPRAAQRRGLSGWVDVVFTVDIDGSVVDVSVRDSNPGETFVSAAINSVEKWEFEPVIEDGVAIQKRAAVRMMFAIQ
ncbi:MAG: TonB family protein, partial [Woeseiaceae bacterium]|nr:TonB family protein [Woeseiaceae bacterium]